MACFACRTNGPEATAPDFVLCFFCCSAYWYVSACNMLLTGPSGPLPLQALEGLKGDTQAHIMSTFPCTVVAGVASTRCRPTRRGGNCGCMTSYH